MSDRLQMSSLQNANNPQNSSDDESEDGLNSQQQAQPPVRRYMRRLHIPTSRTELYLFAVFLILLFGSIPLIVYFTIGFGNNGSGDSDSTNTTSPGNTEDPNTNNPITNDPNTNDPITNDPNTNDPNTNDPNTNDPNTGDSNTDDPNTDDPNTDDPKTNDDRGSNESSWSRCTKVSLAGISTVLLVALITYFTVKRTLYFILINAVTSVIALVLMVYFCSFAGLATPQMPSICTLLAIASAILSLITAIVLKLRGTGKLSIFLGALTIAVVIATYVFCTSGSWPAALASGGAVGAIAGGAAGAFHARTTSKRRPDPSEKMQKPGKGATAEAAAAGIAGKTPVPTSASAANKEGISQQSSSTEVNKEKEPTSAEQKAEETVLKGLKQNLRDAAAWGNRFVPGRQRANSDIDLRSPVSTRSRRLSEVDTSIEGAEFLQSFKVGNRKGVKKKERQDEKEKQRKKRNEKSSKRRKARHKEVVRMGKDNAEPVGLKPKLKKNFVQVAKEILKSMRPARGSESTSTEAQPVPSTEGEVPLERMWDPVSAEIEKIARGDRVTNRRLQKSAIQLAELHDEMVAEVRELDSVVSDLADYMQTTDSALDACRGGLSDILGVSIDSVHLGNLQFLDTKHLMESYSGGVPMSIIRAILTAEFRIYRDESGGTKVTIEAKTGSDTSDSRARYTDVSQSLGQFISQTNMKGVLDATRFGSLLRPFVEMRQSLHIWDVKGGFNGATTPNTMGFLEETGTKVAEMFGTKIPAGPVVGGPDYEVNGGDLVREDVSVDALTELLASMSVSETPPPISAEMPPPENMPEEGSMPFYGPERAKVNPKVQVDVGDTTAYMNVAMQLFAQRMNAYARFAESFKAYKEVDYQYTKTKSFMERVLKKTERLEEKARLEGPKKTGGEDTAPVNGWESDSLSGLSSDDELEGEDDDRVSEKETRSKNPKRRSGEDSGSESGWENESLGVSSDDERGGEDDDRVSEKELARELNKFVKTAFDTNRSYRKATYRSKIAVALFAIGSAALVSSNFLTTTDVRFENPEEFAQAEVYDESELQDDLRLTQKSLEAEKADAEFWRMMHKNPSLEKDIPEKDEREKALAEYEKMAENHEQNVKNLQERVTAIQEEEQARLDSRVTQGALDFETNPAALSLRENRDPKIAYNNDTMHAYNTLRNLSQALSSSEMLASQTPEKIARKFAGAFTDVSPEVRTLFEELFTSSIKGEERWSETLGESQSVDGENTEEGWDVPLQGMGVAGVFSFAIFFAFNQHRYTDSEEAQRVYEQVGKGEMEAAKEAKRQEELERSNGMIPDGFGSFTDGVDSESGNQSPFERQIQIVKRNGALLQMTHTANGFRTTSETMRTLGDTFDDQHRTNRVIEQARSQTPNSRTYEQRPKEEEDGDAGYDERIKRKLNDAGFPDNVGNPKNKATLEARTNLTTAGPGGVKRSLSDLLDLVYDPGRGELFVKRVTPLVLNRKRAKRYRYNSDGIHERFNRGDTVKVEELQNAQKLTLNKALDFTERELRRPINTFSPGTSIEKTRSAYQELLKTGNLPYDEDVVNFERARRDLKAVMSRRNERQARIKAAREKARTETEGINEQNEEGGDETDATVGYASAVETGATGATQLDRVSTKANAKLKGWERKATEIEDEVKTTSINNSRFLGFLKGYRTKIVDKSLTEEKAKNFLKYQRKRRWGTMNNLSPDLQAKIRKVYKFGEVTDTPPDQAKKMMAHHNELHTPG